jgi:hypothetical protein
MLHYFNSLNYNTCPVDTTYWEFFDDPFSQQLINQWNAPALTISPD